MVNVVFVVPYAMDTSLRFLRAMVALEGVRVGLVSGEPLERIPADLHDALDAFQRVENPVSTEGVLAGVRGVARQWNGRVDRLTGILEQLQEPLAEVRERLGIPGMDRREAENFRDKARMKEVLREHGLPCARHYLAHDADAARAFARECLPLVAKPPAGAGARATVRVNNPDELESYLRSFPPYEDEPLLLEEFVQGREHSFDSVSLGGRHLFHSISRYYPTPLEVLENPWVQWCVVLPREIDTPEFDDIRDAGRRALDALGMVTGMTHMEWFRREDDSLAISEVAARPPGAQFTSLISWAHNRDFYRAWAELIAREQFTPPERRWSVGALFLRAQGEGPVGRVVGVEEAQAELGDLVVESKLPAPGKSRSDTYEGDGYVIVRHPETEAVEAALEKLMATLRVETQG